jgi:serine kinase of HPr protein (carbohydrate metabolism regulator)
MFRLLQRLHDPVAALAGALHAVVADSGVRVTRPHEYAGDGPEAQAGFLEMRFKNPAELVGGLIGMALMAGRGGSLKHCAIAPPYPFSVGERFGLDGFPACQERPAQSV